MAGECELLLTCIFFNDRMARVPVTASIMKEQYCRGDVQQCARYRVFKDLGRGMVPLDLLPNATERCDRLLGAHGPVAPGPR